jgi:hypothetical protein
MNLFFLEIVGDSIWFSLTTPEVTPDLAHQLCLIEGALAPLGFRLRFRNHVQIRRYPQVLPAYCPSICENSAML